MDSGHTCMNFSSLCSHPRMEHGRCAWAASAGAHIHVWAPLIGVWVATCFFNTLCWRPVCVWEGTCFSPLSADTRNTHKGIVGPYVYDLSSYAYGRKTCLFLRFLLFMRFGLTFDIIIFLSFLQTYKQHAYCTKHVKINNETLKPWQERTSQTLTQITVH